VQLSVAVAAQLTTWSQVSLPGPVFVDMLAGQWATGGSLSVTVTVKVQLAELRLELSVAWQVTVLIPLLKVPPLELTEPLVAPLALQVMVTGPQLSAPVTL